MTAYIDIATFELDYSPREVLQLSDRLGAGVRVDQVIQRAIDRGAAIINTELARCYVIPLQAGQGESEIPPHVLTTLSEWNGRIARYLLADDQRGNGADAEKDSEPTRRYKEVMTALRGNVPENGCLLLRGVMLNPNAAAAAGGPGDNVMFGDAGSLFGRGDYGPSLRERD